MSQDLHIALIIPALDEEATIGDVVRGVDRELVDDVVVVDNGSRDRTALRAREAGAQVIVVSEQGYGRACLAGIAAVPSARVLVFMDGDGSDDPAGISRLVTELRRRNADLVVGSRTIGNRERGSLAPLQLFGNALTCALLRLLWGARCTDLGPLRAIRRDALERLSMADPDYGWIIEMQVRAVQQGLKCYEVPVSHRRRRGGRSKVSGTIVGSYRAGRRILGYVFAAKIHELRERLSASAS